MDSTVIEADIRYPSDAMLALQGVRAPAREGRRLGALVGQGATRVRDRSRAVGRRVRAISRTLARRTGQAKAGVMRLNGEGGRLIARSAREARRLAGEARARARGRGAGAKLRAAAGLEELARRCERVARQIEQRVRGERIEDRLISLADADARPIRKGKLGKPNEFGYVAQIAELAPNTRRGARGFLLPPASLPGNPAEVRLLPATTQELEQLGVRPREIACDGAFNLGPTAAILAPLGAELYVAGRAKPGARRTRKRLARFRTGVEGRISHLKRRYGLRRSRLKGFEAPASGAAGRSWPTTSTLTATTPEPGPRPTATPFIGRRVVSDGAHIGSVMPFIRGK